MESKSGRGRKRQSLQVRVTDKGQQVNQAHDAYLQKSDYLHSLDVELLLEDKENPCPHPEMLKASLTLKKQCFIDVRFTSDGLFAFTLGRVRIDPEGFGRYEDQELDKLKVFVTVGNSKDWLYRKHLTLEQSREELVTRESYQRLTDEEKELLMWLSQQIYKARLEFRELFSKNPDNSNLTKSKIAKARFAKLREVKELEEFERYATKLVSSSRQVCGGSIVMGIVLERTIDALIEKGFPKRFISGLLDLASGMINFKNFSATPLHHQRLGQNQALYCIDGFTRNFYVDNWVLTEELRLNLGIGDCQNLAPQELMDVFTSTMFQARPQLTDACVNLATDVTSLKSQADIPISQVGYDPTGNESLPQSRVCVSYDTVSGTILKVQFNKGNTADFTAQIENLQTLKDDLQNAGIAVHQASHLFDQGMSSEVILLLHMVLNIPFSAFLTVSENSEIKKIIESKALANGFLNSFKSLQLNVTDLHNSVLAKGKRKSKSQHIYQEQAFDMRCCIRELGWYEKVLGKKNSDPNVKLFRQLTNGWTQEQIDEVLDRELLITVVPSYVHQQERKELHASLWETCAGITLIKGKLTKPTKAELKLLKPVYLSEVTKIDYQSIQYLGAEEIYEKARTLETTTDGGLKHKLMLELFEESYEGRVHDQKKQIKLKSRIQQMEQSTEHVSDADKIKAINEMLASFEPERANDPLMFYIVDYEQLDQHYDNELFKTIISTESRGLSAIERYDNRCLIEPVNMRLKRIGGKSLMCSTMSTIMVRFMAVLLAATFQLQVLAINKDLCKVKNKNKTDNLYILDFNTWFETINQQFFLVDYQNRSISHNGLSEKFTENLQKVDVKTPEYINYGRVYEKLWSDREYNPNRPNYVEKM